MSKMKKILLVLIVVFVSLGLTSCEEKIENQSKKTPSKEHPSKKTPSKEHPSKKTPSKEHPTKKTPSKETPKGEHPG